MADEWARALQFVDDLAALAERLVGEEVLYHIDVQWPRWTGWSAANNHVNEGNVGDFPLNPPTRPTDEGELFGVAQQVLEYNLEILARHEAPGMIAIGNAVPYAADVGFLVGNGTAIYEEGGKTGGRAGIRQFNVEWPNYVKP